MDESKKLHTMMLPDGSLFRSRHGELEELDFDRCCSMDARLAHELLKIVHLQNKANEAFLKARRCPIVDDEFPALIHAADSYARAAIEAARPFIKD